MFLEVAPDLVGVERVDPKTEMIEVAPLRSGRRAADAAELAVRGDEIDHRLPRFQMVQPEALDAPVEAAADDVDVETDHRFDVAGPDYDVVDPLNLHARIFALAGAVAILPAMVEQLIPPLSAGDLDDLAALLVDTVEGGGSVSFLTPLSLDDARAFWRRTFENSSPNAVFLVVREENHIVATVQLHPAWAPNQPHRADVAKLMVHRRSRRAGHGRALMAGLERRAREAGFTLLTLDTVRGDAAERLYRQTGWQCAGVIPDYALDPHGTLCDTVVFYKKLD